jgi:DNA-binding MarR family transcriptional regulator
LPGNEEKLYAVITEVRVCFNRLKTLAEQLHGDIGVNASMRAVMESLSMHGSQSVPDIARRKGVSRQHIQTIMNLLVEAGFAEAFDNPAHLRSPLFDLSAKGRKAFTTVQRRERAPLKRLSVSMPARKLEQMHSLLLELNAQLNREIDQGDSSGNP